MRRGLPRVIPAFAAPLCNPNYKLNSRSARPPLRRDAFPGEPEGGPDGAAAPRPLPGARSQPPRTLRWDGGGPAPRDGRRGVLRAAAAPLPTAACALPARPRGAVERGPPAPGSGTAKAASRPVPSAAKRAAPPRTVTYIAGGSAACRRSPCGLHRSCPFPHQSAAILWK